LTRALVTELLNGIEQFLIEYRHMLHSTVTASTASIFCVHVPVESRARALFAEVAGEWTDI
jgi:hypothetical protein